MAQDFTREAKQERVIEIDNGRPVDALIYPENSVRSNEYTLVSFFPKALFKTFQRPSRIWFTMILFLLALFPEEASPLVFGFYFVTYLAVILAHLAQEGTSDWSRRQADRKTNSQPTYCWDSDKQIFLPVQWRNLKVGHVVLLKRGPVPADILLLATSDVNSTCSIATSSLDGHSNTKVRNSPEGLADFLVGSKPVVLMQNFFYLNQARLTTELPNACLYAFAGQLKLATVPKHYDVNIDNMLLRGNSLVNTKWAVGLVVFTGTDMKVMRNMTHQPQKRPLIQHRTDSAVSVLLVVTILFTLTSSLLFMAKEGFTPDSARIFVSYLAQYQYCIPIHLPLALWATRKVQAKYIEWDRECRNGRQTPSVKSVQFNEELGRTEYVFTDKTGTLTRNQLKFKKCLVQDRIFTPDSLKEHLSQTRDAAAEFVQCMSVCHTLRTRETSAGSITYDATSSDELALGQAAAELGYTFMGSRKGNYYVKINDVLTKFHVVGLNEFTPERRRMSILVQPENSEEAILYCKGACNSMFPRCTREITEYTRTIDAIEEVSNEGFRVLVFAKRVLSAEQVAAFKTRFSHAKHAMYSRDALLNELADEFEVDLEVLGVSAIEDTVQPGVPETVNLLMRAGIKVWMLTGDQSTAAVSTAYSAAIFTPHMKVYRLYCSSLEEARLKLKRCLQKHVLSKDTPVRSRHITRTTTRRTSLIQKMAQARSITQHFSSPLNLKEPLTLLEPEQLRLGLATDGETLGLVFSDNEALKLFMMLATLCQGVVAAELSPLQKAALVAGVKKNLAFHPVTLAIGDGASDVPMMHTANIGVGVTSTDSTVVGNMSDLNVCSFKDLGRLVLVHGPWNDYRSCKLVVFMIYKGCLVSLLVFYYSFFSQHSAAAPFLVWLLILHVMLLGTVPLILLGCLDYDLDQTEILRKPWQPATRFLGKNFSMKLILVQLLYALVESCVIFFSVLLVAPVVAETGQTFDGEILGIVMLTSLVGVTTIALLCEATRLTWLLALGTVFVAVLYCVHITALSSFWPERSLIYGVGHILRGSPLILLVSSSIIAICLGIRLAVSHIRAWKQNRLRIKAQTRHYLPCDDESDNHDLRTLQYRQDLRKILADKLSLQDIEETKVSDMNAFSRLTLKFTERSVEKRYTQYLISRRLPLFRRLFAMLILGAIGFLVIDLILDAHSLVESVLESLATIVCVLIYLFTRTRYFAQSANQFLLLLVIAALTYKLVYETINAIDGHVSNALFYSLIFLLFNIETFRMSMVGLAFLCAYLVKDLYKYLTELENHKYIFTAEYTLLTIVIFVRIVLIGRQIEQHRRKEFVMISRLRTQFKKSQDVLGNLLPNFVKERVNRGIRYIAEEKGMVTILFCDIYNFDSICSTLDPSELTELLDKYFSTLDRLCNQFGVTKIETVNKTYMACAGLEDVEERLSPELRSVPHAERCIDMALAILKLLSKVHLKSGDRFTVKIGINSGPVTAGVVGKHKPQFSLVGDTVNTASRMCSTIKIPGQIQMSKATYDQISSQKYVLYPSKVQAKGKGLMHTYYVESSLRQTTSKYAKHDSCSNVLSESSDYTFENATQLEPRYHFARTAEEAEDVRIPDLSLDFDEDPDFIMAGPVQFIECMCDEFPHNQKYRLYSIERHKKKVIHAQWSNFLVFSVVSLIDAIEMLFALSTNFYVLAVMRSLAMLTLLLYALQYRHSYRSPLFCWWTLLVYSIASIACALAVRFQDSELVHISVLEFFFFNLGMNFRSGLGFGYILLGSLISISMWIFSLFHSSLHGEEALVYALLAISFATVNAFCAYLSESEGREHLNMKMKTDKELEITDTLLTQMMPSHVLTSMKDGVSVTDRHAAVTILYADISGFTAWAADRQPIQVIGMLSKLFCQFDKLCVKHHVYKVHTIGDCYVVLGFIDSNYRNPLAECVNVLNMALDMLQTIQQVNRKHDTEFAMRIGVHTGTIIAGITGTSIVRYDIYGSDNDIANIMESEGASGKVNVSVDTMNLLVENEITQFAFQPNKPVVYVPTKKIMDSYFLVAKSN